MDQLERILSSRHFHVSEQRRAFLKFVVDQTLAGNEGEIKGYTVATQVFGRDTDFDQKNDPVVSVHAGKLRRALERYYLTAGRNDSIRINIPKGTYVPTFTKQSGYEEYAVSESIFSNENRYMGSWPTLSILPFENLTDDLEQDYLAVGLRTELAHELARYQEIRVLMVKPLRQAERPSVDIARFVLGGSVRKDQSTIKVTVYLKDTLNDTQIWSDAYQSDFAATKLIAFQEEIAQVIAVKTVGERGVIYKTLSAESRNIPPKKLKTYEAILRYYDWDLSHTPERLLRALEALEIALKVESTCGQAWGMLGLLYGFAYTLEFPGFKENFNDRAIEYCKKGVQLNPANQRSRVRLALIRLFQDDVVAAQHEIDFALALNPNSLLMLDGIGYVLTLLGDWDRGPALIRRIMRLNPYYNRVVHYALWVDWVRRDDYEKAYLETFNFKQPPVFWNPLMRTAALGCLGRIGEAKMALGELSELKPDFQERGRTLIKYYIKFEDIIEKVVDGLAKVGMCLD
jgi:adenylate cyclase